jgi:hypothetical protein
VTPAPRATATPAQKATVTPALAEARTATVAAARAAVGAERVLDLLRELVAATPPPEGGCDPADLIDIAAGITAAREPICAELGRAVAASGPASGALTLAEELAELDARWQAALSAARVELTRRTAASRRRYG